MSSWNEFESLISSAFNKKVQIEVKRNGSIIEKEFVVCDSLGLLPWVPPVIGSVKIAGPAHRIGLKTGDRVIKINGDDIETWNELVERIRSSRNVELRITYQSNNEVKESIIIPAPYYDPILKDTIGQIGVMMPMARKPVLFFQAISMSFKRTGEIIWLTLKTLYQLIIGKVSRKALGGPIAIAILSGESARWGFESLLGLLSLISINLGLVNLFPIPGLDGGHIVLAIIESIRRKRFSRKTRLIIQQVGYTILLLLIIYVTYNDITR